MTSLAGGIGLIIIAAIAILYADNWLVRFFSAAVLLIFLGTQAALALDGSGSPDRFYWSLLVTASVVTCVAISRIRPHRDK
jgi:O-antigen/teichoic acid export membrane protein